MRRVAPRRANDPVRLGPYRIDGRLGTGGQGVVYLARDSADQFVAVKTLHADFAVDPQAASRFVKELTAAQKVAPFCTAQVLDSSADPEQPYIVSEYVDGPSLQQAVTEDGPRGGNTLHRLAVATATALVAIHEADVVHRDFKPHNVLLGPDGPRVIDFGIARALDGNTTTTSRPIGTPAYMAPEQLAGRRVGAPADVFAWGGVMVFAATGRPAFGKDSIPAIIARIAHGEPVLDGFPGALRELVQRCLTKEPADRPTARQVLDYLLGNTQVLAEPRDATGEEVDLDDIDIPSYSLPRYRPPARDAAPRTTQPSFLKKAAAKPGRGTWTVLIVTAIAVAVAVAGLAVWSPGLWRTPRTTNSPRPAPPPPAGTPTPSPSPTKPARSPRPSPQPRPTLAIAGCSMGVGDRSCAIRLTARGSAVRWRVTGASASLSASGSGTLAAGRSTTVTAQRRGLCIGGGEGSVSFSPGGSASVTWQC